MSAWTLTFQVVNFVVLAALLRRFLFRPVSAMIAKRQEQLARASAEEERVRKEAAELETRGDEARRTIELEREHVLTEAREQAGREREASLAQARQEAAGIVEAGRSELETEREKAAEVMVARVAELATGIARRLLEQVAAAPITEAFLERLCTQLDGFPAERKGSLRDELDGTALFVATAPELGDDARKRWSGSIGERLGARVRVSFVRDDSLVAGAELRFPRTILSFCWRDALRAAREEVLRHADGR
jgi:F-type H+-transporting ATPase subunit b